MTTWQSISVNINRQRSSDISVIGENFLGFARTCGHGPVILSIQETKSWDVPDLTLLGYVCYGSKFGFATLSVSDQCCTIRRSWKFEERCTAILFGTTVVMAAYALDSGKNTETHEACISSVLEVLQGRTSMWSQSLPHYRRS